MNKKISTMFASTLLMIGAVFSSVNAQVAKDVEFTKDTDGKYYYIGTPVNGTATTFLIANEIEVAAKGASFTTLEAVSTLPSGDNADLALFKIAKVSGTGVSAASYFTLTNKKTGATVKFNVTNGTAPVMITTGDAKAAKYTDLLQYPTKNSDDKYIVTTEDGVTLVPQHGGNPENAAALTLTGTTFAFGTAGTSFQLLGVSTETVSASTLNEKLKNGFIFNAKDVTNNIFAAQTIKAFEVTTPLRVETGYTIPAGTYFATDYPKELIPAGAVMSADLFRQCTFIAVDPVTNLVATDKDAQKAGKNFDFETVSGDDFNFYTVPATDKVNFDKTKVTQGSQISIYNACFLVQTNKDNEDKYSVTVENFRYRKEAAADKKEHGQTKIFIASAKVSNKQVLLTATGDAAFTFTLGDAPIAKPMDLLNDSTASVYNISFLSGEKATSEKGKYLGVGVKSGSTFSFLAQGTAIAALNTPQYQFVISAVDTDESTITFTNRETGLGFTCTLFKTAKDGEYLVADATVSFTIANLKADGTVDYASSATDLAGTTIRLTAVTPDKYAGFANRDANAGYANITFALDDVSADKLYLAVTGAGTITVPYTVEVATAKASLASLFELVKSEKPIIDIRNNYVYNKDGAATVKIKGDTVAYYTYAIKWINPKLVGEYFLTDNLEAVKMQTGETAADMSQFIIKENKDGSISIMAEDDLDASISILACDKSKSVTINSGSPYIVLDADAVKSFLVAEELGASLEAKNQHLAFELTTGGFLSMNAAAEGVVAIKTAANEDLTFWVDSADSQATLPAFFISKGKDASQRLFMYYAKDSAEYYINNPRFIDANGNYKMIFKAATLVNGDTLATTVNGKNVNVAAEADASGVLGGLDYFRYNIFKADNAGDAYVIRCKESNEYLTSVNGLLTLDGDRAKAMQVYAKAQGAPTANESIDADASVSVIAKDGAIEIIGAEGKRVSVCNILGQVIANTVITSSNATITLPAGIVVVVVEGEDAVKAIVK